MKTFMSDNHRADDIKPRKWSVSKAAMELIDSKMVAHYVFPLLLF